MTAKIFENSMLLKALNWVHGDAIDGLTIGPFIFLAGDEKNDPVLVNHERIHTLQYRESYYIGFLLVYVYDYLANRYNGMSDHHAYMNTRAEKEAYKYEDCYECYMKRRITGAWLHYDV